MFDGHEWAQKYVGVVLLRGFLGTKITDGRTTDLRLRYLQYLQYGTCSLILKHSNLRVF